jgi:hypothetical protein
VGLVGNQPIVRAGALDPAALAKEMVFVQLCGTFGLPLVFLHDVPGLMIGTQAEPGGILHGYEALVSAIAEATVPKVGVVLSKAYDGGHFAMGGRPTRPDFLYAWPSAELGFTAPETGIRTIHRRRLEKVFARAGPAGARGAGRGAHGRMDQRGGALGGRRAPLARRRHRTGPDPGGRRGEHRHRTRRTAVTGSNGTTARWARACRSAPRP